MEFFNTPSIKVLWVEEEEHEAEKERQTVRELTAAKEVMKKLYISERYSINICYCCLKSRRKSTDVACLIRLLLAIIS